MMIHDLTKKAQEGELELEWKSEELAKLKREVRRANRRSFAAITAAAMMISAAVILGLDGFAPRMWGGAPFMPWFLGGLAVMLNVGKILVKKFIKR